MDNNNNILDRVGRRSGMRVPEGYFDDFAARMAASLPEQEWERQPADEGARRSLWHVLRPYVYMAAMFAGIWLMMSVFDHIRPSADISIDNNPVLAEAVSSDTFINEYLLDNSDSDELIDNLWNDQTQSE